MTHSAKDDVIVVTMDRRSAEKITLGLADLLCWLRGFNAGRQGTELVGSEPLGVEELRTLRIKMLNALEKK